MNLSRSPQNGPRKKYWREMLSAVAVSVPKSVALAWFLGLSVVGGVSVAGYRFLIDDDGIRGQKTAMRGKLDGVFSGEDTNPDNKNDAGKSHIRRKNSARSRNGEPSVRDQDRGVGNTANWNGESINDKSTSTGKNSDTPHEARRDRNSARPGEDFQLEENEKVSDVMGHLRNLDYFVTQRHSQLQKLLEEPPQEFFDALYDSPEKKYPGVSPEIVDVMSLSHFVPYNGKTLRIPVSLRFPDGMLANSITSEPETWTEDEKALYSSVREKYREVAAMLSRLYHQDQYGLVRNMLKIDNFKMVRDSGEGVNVFAGMQQEVEVFFRVDIRSRLAELSQLLKAKKLDWALMLTKLKAIPVDMIQPADMQKLLEFVVSAEKFLLGDALPAETMDARARFSASLSGYVQLLARRFERDKNVQTVLNVLKQKAFKIDALYSIYRQRVEIQKIVDLAETAADADLQLAMTPYLRVDANVGPVSQLRAYVQSAQPDGELKDRLVTLMYRLDRVIYENPVFRNEVKEILTLLQK